MQISEKRLKEFKELYKQEFGIELSDSETYEKAYLLISYARMCILPVGKSVSEVYDL